MDYIIDNPQITNFIVVYGSIPKEVCIALATHDWGSNYSSGLVAISAGIDHQTDPNSDELEECTPGWNNNYNVACPGDAENPTPMSVTKAALACNCADTNTCSVGLAFQ